MDIKGLVTPLVTLAFNIAGTAKIPATLKLGASNTYTPVSDTTVTTYADEITLEVIRTSKLEMQGGNRQALTEAESRQTVIIFDRSELDGAEVVQEDVVEIEGETRQIKNVETDPLDAVYILTLV